MAECSWCDGKGWTMEAEPSDPSGQTAMQARCDECRWTGQVEGEAAHEIITDWLARARTALGDFCDAKFVFWVCDCEASRGVRWEHADGKSTPECVTCGKHGDPR